MHAFDPSQADFLFHRSAGELEPRLIEVVANRIRSSHPNQHRRRVCHHLKTRLAFPEPFFSTLPLCDIAVYRVIDDMLTRTRSDRNGEKGYINLTPILAPAYGFHLNSPDLPELICVFSGMLHQSLRHNELINRPSQNLLHRMTEHAREFLVGAKNATVGI